MPVPDPEQVSITHRLRKAIITDLPSIYRGERHYIQRWEPSHEGGWLRQTERHLADWTSHFDRMVIATVILIISEPIAYLRENPHATPRAGFPHALRMNETKFGDFS